MFVTPAQWSWNSARLVALILNALFGLEEYYNTHYKELDANGLFGLRIIEGYLKSVEKALGSIGHNVEIVNELRSLSKTAGTVANRALAFVADRDKDNFNQFRFLLEHPYEVEFVPQRTDKNLRWEKKHLRSSRTAGVFPVSFLFTEKNSDRCFAELLATNYDASEQDHICNLSRDCMERMVGQRGLTGYYLTHQILYVAVALQTPCTFTLSKFIASTKNQTVQNLLTEFCTNMIDELGIHMRNPEMMTRLDHDGRNLLMEQIFACGEFGFVEVSSIHFLTSVLSWQNPVSGCFVYDNVSSAVDPTDNNNEVIGFRPTFSKRKRILSNVVDKDFCSTRSATAAAGALVVFLRLLVERGPWLEYYLSDQAITMRSIAAEGIFRQYHYDNWAHDSLTLFVRRGSPPKTNWSPDLLAYLCLLSIIVGVSVAMHFCNKPKIKQLYYFSYKKL